MSQIADTGYVVLLGEIFISRLMVGDRFCGGYLSFFKKS